MAAVALIGFGGHGRDIERIWMAVHPQRKLALYDDAWSGGEGNEYWPPPPDDLDEFYLGVNDCHVRAEMAKRWARTTAEPLVHPTASVIGHSALGPGVVVAQQVVMGLFSHLGEHTHVNYHAAMTRTTIGNYCTIAPGVTICGDVVIGDRVFIGAGATIINLITIGDDAYIRAGSVVTRDIAAGERY